MKKTFRSLWQKKPFRVTFWCGVSFAAVCALFVLVCNLIVIFTAAPHREAPEDIIASRETYDCILVLGAGIKADGSLSNLLRDRMTMGVRLMEEGGAPVLLLTGDGKDPARHDEVGAMEAFAVEKGIAEATILKDPLGLSTYESLWRAKYVYGMEKVIIVTQQYHLYRSIYAAEALGLEAYGVACDYRQYSGQLKRDLREVLARAKDVATGIFQPKPTYLGEAIPIWGDGNLTNG